MRSRPATLVTLLAALLGACGGFERGPYWEDGSTSAASETAGEAPSFAAEIRPLLVDGCASCHAAGASAGDTAFLLGDDAEADLEETLAFVDLDDPPASRLLTKALGVGHVAGAIFSPGGPEEALLVAWIEGGAPP